MKKKVLILFLVFVMAFSLAACSDDTGDSQPTATVSSGNTGSAPTATKPATEATPETKPTESAPTEPPTPDPDATPTPEPIDAFVLDFYHETSDVYDMYLGDVSGAGQNCTWEWVENSGLEVNITANDPYVAIDFLGDTFNLEEYHVMKLRIKNPTPCKILELFFPMSMGSIDATDVLQYARINASDTDFSEYVVDLTEVKGENFVAREVGGIRLDLLSLDAVIGQLPDDGWTVAVDYLGFFPTVEAAEAYSTH